MLWPAPLPSTDPHFSPKDTLRAWQEKNHPWLELSDVHRETTDGIRVTVIPFYMGARVGNTYRKHTSLFVVGVPRCYSTQQIRASNVTFII